jgi:DNA-binding Lrp family transcriptional regulator
MDDPSALDDTDRRILQELVVDGRLSVNALAERANVSRATAYGRLKRLTDTGVIKRFSAVVDPAKVGLPIAALILVNVSSTAGKPPATSWRRCPASNTWPSPAASSTWCCWSASPMW